MSEEKLNEQYIKDHIQGICQDCIYLDKIVPIIREMLSEAYINGLEQGKFDRQMLELAVQKYKEMVEEKENQQKEFIEYLKNKEKEFDMMGDAINSGACLGILREYKEIIGDKDE